MRVGGGFVLGWFGAVIAVSAAIAASPAGLAEEPPVAERSALPPAGVIEINADGQRKEGDVTVAYGHPVDVRYGDMVLQGDYIQVNAVTKNVIATGNVVLQQGSQRMVGERLVFNLDTRLGTLFEAWGFADPDLYMSADEIEKVGGRRFELRGATLTSCTQPTPQWRLRASRAIYEEDRYVRLYHTRLEFFGVPVFYLPIFQYPAKRDRSTGFLFPSFGESDQRGFSIANSFFWALGESYDATFSHEWYKNSGNALRSEFRYAPSHDLNGTFSTDHFLPKDADGSSLRLRLTHNQRMGRSWRAGATIDYASDDTIDREISNNLNNIAQRRRQSQAFLERNWSRYSLRMSGNHQVIFFGDQESTQFQGPELALGVRDTKLAGPLYGGIQANAGYYGLERTGTALASWSRADVTPSLTLPWSPFPWLDLRAQGDYRLTWWSDSFVPGTFRTVRTTDDFLRHFGRLNLSLTGPVVQRIFNTPGSGYSDKFKHQIEPQVRFSYAEDGDPLNQSQSLDNVDRAGRGKVTRFDFVLRNRVLARRSLGPGMPRTPSEILLFEVGTGLDLEQEGDQRLGALNGNLRFVPVQKFIATYRFQFDLHESFFPSQAMQVTYQGAATYLDVSYSRQSNLTDVVAQDLRATIGTSLFAQRLQLGGSVAYDVENRDLRDFRSDLVYRTQCCGLGLGYRRIRLGSRQENQVQFSVSLKNIGTVFDYTLGEGGY